MNEKEIYSVYVGTMKIQKKYAAHVRDMTYLPELIADINQLNSAHNSNFCNAMAEILRQWFIGRFPGVEPEKITAFYTDLWRLHKKYLHQERNESYWESFVSEVNGLAAAYPSKQAEKFLLEIADDFEIDGISDNRKKFVQQ